MKGVILFFGVALLASTVSGQLLSEVVETDKGPVQGRIFKTTWHSIPYSQFSGIPFAKPPLGKLRFKDPIEPDPWVEVKNATMNSNRCKQLIAVTATGSEDCLYLSVYTPQITFGKIEKLRPVMLWVYGGGFATGSSIPGVYQPDFFLEEDVVFVSFNYRVTIFGYLALDIPGVLGNAGLKDQVMAMKWVQKNIAQFGGDPNRVTLFGESAGGASVGYQLLLPQSKGLFHQAILQSGSPLCPWAFRSRDHAIQRSFIAGANLDFHTTDQAKLLDFLQTVDENDLIWAAHVDSSNALPEPIVFESIPTTTTDSLDACPISKFRNGDFHHVPVLLGYNADEGILFASTADEAELTLYNAFKTLSNLSPSLLDNLGVDLVNLGANLTTWGIIDIGTAYYFSGPVDLTQRYIAHYNGLLPTYFYRLSYKSNYNLRELYNNRINGTAHADDVDLLFNIRLMWPTDPTDPFNVFRKKMVSLWANFAKYGDPTPDNIPINGAAWLPSGTIGQQLNIDVINTMNPRLLQPQHQILERVYDATLPLTTECGLAPINPPLVF